MKNKRLTETDLIAKHPHIVEGSLQYDAIQNKQTCTIRTRGVDGLLDGNTREIATSDLHQCFWTPEVKAVLDNQKRSAKRAIKAAAKAAAKAELVTAEG